VEDIKKFLSEHRDKPYISCEYAHAMGNSCGAIYKYTELTETEELYQGGFIWDYIDQSLTVKDRYGVEYQAYGGDFDDRPNDFSFSGNGICYGKDRAPSPKMQEVKFAYQTLKIDFDDDNNMIITNKNLFTSSDVYNCQITIQKEGKIIEENNGVIAVNPLSEKKIPIPIDIPDGDGEYVLTVSFTLRNATLWANEGHEVAFGQKVFGKREKEEPASCPLTVIHGWCNLGVRGDDFEVLFSNLRGGLVSYIYAGRELIKQPPMPNYWRPMTENDIANLLPFRAAQWKIASMYQSCKYEHGRKATDYRITEHENSVDICFTYHLPTKPEKDALLTYKVYGDGRIDVHLEMDGADEIGELPEFGLLFTLDADYDRLKWYGLGPDETYMDRNHAKLDVYENNVSDNMAKYLRPQECGNKEGVRWATVTDRSGIGFCFSGEDLSFSALPYSPHDIDNAGHTNELPPVLSTYIRVAKAQMGVGGDDTWGALVHPEYLLDTKGKLIFDFSFRGVAI
ncbi:MAG: DUF4981 domain-containing protein, partial [Lachnospiraceae bacterium]|nr:DUF4981 domain-containing protein [Lachnospiraceae bacterium]